MKPGQPDPVPGISRVTPTPLPVWEERMMIKYLNSDNFLVLAL